jgi:hypothetical protein
MRGSMSSSRSTITSMSSLLLLPILFELLLLPVWKSEFVTFVALALLFMNSVGHPVYYASVTGFYLFRVSLSAKERARVLVTGCVGSFISLSCCLYLHYWSWGMSSGMYQNPDSETMLVFSVVIVVAISILMAGIGYAYTEAKKEFGDFF